MTNFWDFSAWGFFNLIAVLLAALMAAHMLKRSVRWLEASLIPTSVLGGAFLLVISVVLSALAVGFLAITGDLHSFGAMQAAAFQCCWLLPVWLLSFLAV